MLHPAEFPSAKPAVTGCAGDFWRQRGLLSQTRLSPYKEEKGARLLRCSWSSSFHSILSSAKTLRSQRYKVLWGQYQIESVRNLCSGPSSASNSLSPQGSPVIEMWKVLLSSGFSNLQAIRISPAACKIHNRGPHPKPTESVSPGGETWKSLSPRAS